MMAKLHLYCLAFASMFVMHAYAAQNTPQAEEIVFGQTCSLSGHFACYGSAIQHGIVACFEEINSKGGVHGKKLRLITLDDRGDVQTAQKNITKLRDEHHISMLLGVMGSRTALSLIPDIKQGNLALFFLWGNDPALNDPTLTHVINGPGLIQPQIDALVNYIHNKLRLNSVAIFHADDDFSSDAAHQLSNKLKEQNITPLCIEDYNRFTMDIKHPAQKLIASDPRAVICLATSMPTVKLINYFFEQGHFGTQFLGIDSTFLVPDILRSKGARFQFSSAVPNPVTSKIKLAQSYKQALKRFFPQDDPSILSFTYYISAMIMVEAIKKISGPVTKEKILEAVASMHSFDLQGFNINFNSKTRHAFGDKTWII